MLRAIFLPLIASLLSLSARAGLEWREHRLELRGQTGQAHVTGVFYFSNTGDKPVTIATIQTSCGCTTAELGKRVYSPGESGEIAAKMEIGGRRGLQVQRITVATDEPAGGTHTLELVVDVGTPVAISSHLLQWPAGRPAEEKTIDVAVSDRAALKELQIEGKTGEVEVRVESLEGGALFRVHAKPRSTERPLTQAIKLLGSTATGEPRAYQFYVVVR